MIGQFLALIFWSATFVAAGFVLGFMRGRRIRRRYLKL